MDRRSTLLVLGTLGAAPGLAASSAATPPQGLRFEHGVASGDPLSDRLIIWTRLSGAGKSTDVHWEMATDEGFSAVMRRGRFMTDAGRDYTVKIDVSGLKPDTSYYYRFHVGEVRSPTGRARTLPLQTDKVVLAVVSCALHSNGFFNAYRAVADLERVDCVVHLGDYIYEYGAGLTDYGMGNGRILGRIPEPAHEIVTLKDYRRRHAQYKRDGDLQAAHARAAWICVFDDHEICNNPWEGGAQNHNPEKGEGDWLTRKTAALKAYREWMPIRDPAPGQLSEAIYRSFRFGQMAELVMVETRLTGRSKQLDFATDMKMAKAADGTLSPDFADFRRQLNDPSRELFGPVQGAWLQATLSASVKDGVRWQVLGNQVLMAKIAGPDILKLLGPAIVNSALAVVPQPTRTQLKARADIFSQTPPLPFNLDAWDGYPAARERFYDILKATKARTVVMSGDSHCAWANNLHDDAGELVAVEVGVTALSSPTKCLDAWLPDLGVAQCLADCNPEVVAADDAHNGFVRLTLTADHATAEWMAVNTIVSRDFKTSALKRFRASALPAGVGPLRVA